MEACGNLQLSNGCHGTGGDVIGRSGIQLRELFSPGTGSLEMR